MSRRAIALKFEMRWCPDEASYWAEKLATDVNLPHLMADEDKNFGGSLVLDFRKWWRHVQPKNSYICWGSAAEWLLRRIWNPLADIVLGSPEFNFLATLVNSQLVCLPPVGILNQVMFIWIFVFHGLFTFVLKSRNKEWPIKYTFYIHFIRTFDKSGFQGHSNLKLLRNISVTVV